jgi:hypothetical protein
MKKADLEKQLGKKIAGRMMQEAHSDRYGAASGQVGDKREQRERDKAAGLVPFAVKLPQDLVARLQAIAVERGTSMNELTAMLLEGTFAPPAVAEPEPKAKPKPKAKSEPAGTLKPKASEPKAGKTRTTAGTKR